MRNKIYDKTKKYIKNNYKELLFLIFCILLVVIKLPYVVYAPGGTINTSKRIHIENGYEYNGSLDMAYVTMFNGTIVHTLLSFVIPNWDLVKSDNVTLEDESINDMVERDKYYLEESLDNAAIVAYKKANKELLITKTNNVVLYISNDSNTNLNIGDIIISADNKTINTLEEYKELVKSKNIGSIIDFKIERDGKKTTAFAEVKEMEGPNTGLLFVTTYDYVTDPKLTYKVKDSESGPSGGLMLSLTIYNNLIKEDITKGRKIVGTGTIDINGVVGEIGGVKYKLLGAIKEKAEVFLVPKENYNEAKKIKEDNDYKIEIVSISTFDEAIDYLNK